MIEYHFKFEETTKGFSVHMQAPPSASTTLKERQFANLFSSHIKAILKRVSEITGGRFEGPKDN